MEDTVYEENKEKICWALVKMSHLASLTQVVTMSRALFKFDAARKNQSKL